MKLVGGAESEEAKVRGGQSEGLRKWRRIPDKDPSLNMIPALQEVVI